MQKNILKLAKSSAIQKNMFKNGTNLISVSALSRIQIRRFSEDNDKKQWWRARYFRNCWGRFSNFLPSGLVGTVMGGFLMNVYDNYQKDKENRKSIRTDLISITKRTTENKFFKLEWLPRDITLKKSDTYVGESFEQSILDSIFKIKRNLNKKEDANAEEKNILKLIDALEKLIELSSFVRERLSLSKIKMKLEKKNNDNKNQKIKDELEKGNFYQSKINDLNDVIEDLKSVKFNSDGELEEIKSQIISCIYNIMTKFGTRYAGGALFKENNKLLEKLIKYQKDAIKTWPKNKGKSTFIINLAYVESIKVDFLLGQNKVQEAKTELEKIIKNLNKKIGKHIYPEETMELQYALAYFSRYLGVIKRRLNEPEADNDFKDSIMKYEFIRNAQNGEFAGFNESIVATLYMEVLVFEGSKVSLLKAFDVFKKLTVTSETVLKYLRYAQACLKYMDFCKENLGELETYYDESLKNFQLAKDLIELGYKRPLEVSIETIEKEINILEEKYRTLKLSMPEPRSSGDLSKNKDLPIKLELSNDSSLSKCLGVKLL